MAFFKTTRDQLKANGFLSHLEFAVQQFRPDDMYRCNHHLHGALKGLDAVREARAEYIFSDDGLQYVARLSAQLTVQLRASGFEDLASDAERIGQFAGERLFDRGILHW